MTRNSSGQTGIEYMLIIAVAIMVVAAVVMWLYPTFININNQGKNNTNMYICGNTDCTIDDDCHIVDACDISSTCNTSIGKCQI